MECRDRLIKFYNEEFVATLIQQSTDRKNRYEPKPHQPLQIGDIVLIEEQNTKIMNWPLGIVKETFENDIGEITHAKIKKGSTGEITKRHVTGLVYLFSSKTDSSADRVTENDDLDSSRQRENSQPENNTRPKRAAAVRNARNIRRLIDDNAL